VEEKQSDRPGPAGQRLHDLEDGALCSDSPRSCAKKRSSDLVERLSFVLGGSGFTIVPPVSSALRAVRGLCEIHFSVCEDRIEMAIPVVRLGPDRPVTETLLKYLEGRNASAKGPGKFSVHGDTIWYRANLVRSDGWAEDAASMARSMQETVEKVGPKILNIIR